MKDCKVVAGFHNMSVVGSSPCYYPVGEGFYFLLLSSFALPLTLIKGGEQ